MGDLVSVRNAGGGNCVYMGGCTIDTLCSLVWVLLDELVFDRDLGVEKVWWMLGTT